VSTVSALRIRRPVRFVATLVALASLTAAWAKGADQKPEELFAQRWESTGAQVHRDFPAMAIDVKGTPWVAVIEHDGRADVLKLARQAAEGLEVVAAVSQPGIVHQPAVAVAGDGAVWCFWGQVDERDVVTLRARRFGNGQLDAEVELARSAASDTFADAGTDHTGRVWVAWQSMRRGQGDIFVRWLDPPSGRWSQETAVSKPEGGNWEPRVAFDGRDGAWIAFDSSRGTSFNLYLAHVGLDGRVDEKQLTDTPEYEARVSVAAGKDGKGLWVAAERGRPDWGRPVRGHEAVTGLNAQKRMLLGWFAIAEGTFTEVKVPQSGRLAPKQQAQANLPVLAVGPAGNPWLAWRYYAGKHWRIAVTRYDAAAGSWLKPLDVPDSSFGQDRRAAFACAGRTLWLCWPSDRRTDKQAKQASVFLAQLNGPWATLSPADAKDVQFIAPPEYVIPPSPPRPRDQHHTWALGGKNYRLVFGDLHRHTDFSNCITAQDGCVLEAFRYALDVASLDFLGTSDHTDAAKFYSPYEWWETQRLVDVFHAPGRFTPLYAYEREQPPPWGHRNVVFAQRGGPIVYLHRGAYQASRWSPLYPVEAGPAQITPMELWDVLGRYGQPVAVISHTGATGMGTDWDKYERIDGRVENTVEIFQGARVSYEGLGAPQPTVGLRVNQAYNPANASKAVIPAPPAPIEDFGKERNGGVYQNALANGFKLGVFASSDHISTHTSFGGVYVEENTRLGIVEGLRMRRSIAATDKIFVEFSCNGRPMGEVFEAKGHPELKFSVSGTAFLSRLTLVRNETNYKVWEPKARDFADTFTDPAPLEGENRYYLRVEQTDGSMAWSSPVWVTVSAAAQGRGGP
jgi:hypothetical protein